MFVLLIAVYTVQEMSTDKFHTKADRIYLSGMRIGWPPEPPFLIDKGTLSGGRESLPGSGR